MDIYYFYGIVNNGDLEINNRDLPNKEIGHESEQSDSGSRQPD